MELLSKTLVAAVIIIVVFSAAYYLFKHVFSSTLTESQAISLVKQDILKSSPNALLNVTNVTNSSSGGWNIVMSVIFNATTPCPSYYAYVFNYPQYGFVYRVQNTYVNNCQISGFNSSQSFLISSFPAAIVRSYELGISNVSRFINTYGYSNMNVSANFLKSFKVYNQTYQNVWLVRYSASTANYSVYVVLQQQNGTYVLTYNEPNAQK